MDHAKVSLDDVTELEDVEPGTVARFMETLTPEQRALWPDVKRALRIDGRRNAAVLHGQRTAKDELGSAFEKVKGKITPKLLEDLINNAVLKGDAQMLRILAQLGGQDLSEKPQQAAGPGAQVILLRPHPDTLTPAQEANIVGQIAALLPDPS